MSSYAQSERPTLPPLHTLNLLPASEPQQPSTYDSYARPTCSRLHVPPPSWHHRRRVSTSSSSTTSRTPSPTPSDASSLSPASPASNQKLTATLIPCASIHDADAVIVIAPPLSGPTPDGKPSTLLLTGSALAHLRHPQRQLAKGTRLHPYRFAARPPRRRVCSSSSSSSSSSTGSSYSSA